jgi:hypothetical protein
LRVKSVVLIVLVNVINDGDTGKHAHNVAIGVEHLPDKLSKFTVRVTTLRVSVSALKPRKPRKLRERTKTGLDAARKQGRIGGRRPKLRPNQQDEIVKMVSADTKTAADAARLCNVHPATISRLLPRAGAGTIGVEVL